ncbi:CPBP family intramembrane metalloprotease [Levilactobacillus bambusae]|uniref:CPBP family intramembrane metalloprotease n=2 Tax=Levilactobacillus bambusae TaxID=2024736 RepID=A0A2V1N011_9LACO|nr:CPBP family intramembrane metalloprotease [Levilactobacillus bambusae]
MFGFLILYGVCQFFLQQATVHAKSNVLLHQNIGIMMICSALLIALMGWFYHRLLKKNNPRHFGKTKLTRRRAWTEIGLYVLMYAIQITWSLLLFSHVLKEPANQTELNQMSSQLLFWNNAFSAVVAPLVEELLFRGIFFQYFFVKDTFWSNWLGILVSGFIFGYLHNPALSLNLIFYSALGCVLAFAYLHFRDIRYNIGLHFLNNFLSTL